MEFVFKASFFTACLKSDNLRIASFLFLAYCESFELELVLCDMKERASRLANHVPQGIREAAIEPSCGNTSDQNKSAICSVLLTLWWIHVN